MKRRTFVQALGIAALGAKLSVRQGIAGQVPWSSGDEAPKLKPPAGATDCHHHLYNHNWPVEPTSKLRPADASVADYKKLQQRLGTTRNVIVQPSTYGTDNGGLLESLAAFGETARGVAVVNTSVSQDELKRLHDAGVRGIRFNLADPGGASADMLKPLAERIGALGWHIQVNATPDVIVGNKDALNALPTPLVFDHLARLGALGADHPAYGIVVQLLEKGRGWVKLSGAYLDSTVGPPTYADSTKVAKAFLAAAPNRLLWGTDWPHPTKKEDEKPDDALLLDLFAAWVPDEALRNRILVDHPAALYGFSKSA